MLSGRIRVSDRRTPAPPTLTPAERARTLVASTTALRLGALNDACEVVRHAVVPDGSLLLLAPPDFAVGAVAPRLPSPTVTVVATDVSTVPATDRIRGRLALTGVLALAPEPQPAGVRHHLAGPDPRDLEAAGPVLRLAPERLVLEWSYEGTGTVEVPTEEYREAMPDPLLAHEQQWLPHLNHDHGPLLHALVRRTRPTLAPSTRVRALVLDRHGLVLRPDDGSQDVRACFARPLICGCEVRAAFSAIVDGLSD